MGVAGSRVREVVALVLVTAGCATVPTVACAELSARPDDYRGKKVKVEGFWHRGFHGSWMCESQESGDHLIHLRDVPEQWNTLMVDPLDGGPPFNLEMGRARVRACGTLQPSTAKIERIARTPLALIEVDPECSSIQTPDGQWR